MSLSSSYERVDTREWSVRLNPGDNNRRDPYNVVSLDAVWYPILKKSLRNEEDTFDGENPVGSFYRNQFGGSLEDEIDGRGTMNAKELEKELRELTREELEDNLGISWYKIGEIIRRADIDRTGNIEYKTFLETVQKYRLITERDATKLSSIVRAFAYAEEYTCWPPRLCMLAITLIETAFFVYHCVHLPSAHGLSVEWEGPVPYCSVLIYNPKRRWEVWRFVTYMCVHIGIGHFIFNMIMQIIVGVCLEMQQDGWIGSLRVLTVYLAGVLAGSLGTSLSDPTTYIAGASGGVYALIAAHLATLALNWQEDSAVKIQKVIFKPLTRIVRLTFIIILTIHDVGLAIYVRYFSNQVNTTGFMGHFCGALAGLLVGIFILENRRVRAWETYVQWISIGIFLIFLSFAILWNVFGDEWNKELYGKGRYFPKPDYQLYNDASGNCKHYEFM